MKMTKGQRRFKAPRLWPRLPARESYCGAIAVERPLKIYFWIFPVAVLGSSLMKVTLCGALKCARTKEQGARSKGLRARSGELGARRMEQGAGSERLGRKNRRARSSSPLCLRIPHTIGITGHAQR